MCTFAPEIITGIFSIIIAFIAGVISYRTAIEASAKEVKKLERSFELERKSDVYMIKKEAILDALKFIDTYLSWQDYGNGVTSVRENTSVAFLTLTARECYNKLCLTCNSEHILMCFNKILFDEQIKPMEAYSEFRNAARSELGLEEVNFDPEKTFYSRIGTEALEASTK